LVSSIDYKFQHHVTSGTYFGLKYRPGTFIYRLDESTSIFAPQYNIDSSVFIHTHSPPPIATVIGLPTYSHPDVYTVAFKDGSIAEYTTDLLSAAHSTSPSPSSSLLPSWIIDGANATLFLHSMTKPRREPSTGHLDAALYVVNYLASTKTLGIYFTSRCCSRLETFLHFPLPSSNLLSMLDANWGPQDASTSTSSFSLPLFASRSMSAFYIDLLGPLHWLSKQQKITAASSAEAEIYATDECVKFLLELEQLLSFLGVKHTFMPDTTPIYNDNKACVEWSRNATTKGLRHIQMHENGVRENVASKFVSILHVDGKYNIADIFTKEMKDVAHFVELRDLFMCQRFVI